LGIFSTRGEEKTGDGAFRERRGRRRILAKTYSSLSTAKGWPYFLRGRKKKKGRKVLI